MKVKCLKCGFTYEIEGMGEEMCPKCGCRHWSMKMKEFEKMSGRSKIDRESLEMVENLIGEAHDMAKGFLKKQEDLMHDPFKEQRKAIEKQMDTLDPFHYRVKRKEEGLAFEICDIFNGNKVRIRKIYLDGHIEGFKGDPLVTNHIAPKILALKALLQQMNKDYRDLIEKYLLADLPINPVNLSELYRAQLERINNIKL